MIKKFKKMGLFIRRPKTTIDEVCRHFFDTYIFRNVDFCNDVLHFLTQDDLEHPIDNYLFLKELWALRIELFGLTLWNYIREISKKVEYQKQQMLLIEEVCNEISFTKKYLSELNDIPLQQDIWKHMAFYNQTIAEAINNKPLVNLYGLIPIIKNRGRKESKSSFQLIYQETKKEMFSKDFKKFISDSECLVRLLNRVGSSNDEWQEGYISHALSKKFAERIGLFNDLNWERAFKFESLLLGMYSGNENYIETLPFLPENQYRINKLLRDMKASSKGKKKD